MMILILRFGEDDRGWCTASAGRYYSNRFHLEECGAGYQVLSGTEDVRSHRESGPSPFGPLCESLQVSRATAAAAQRIA